ncbi:uncharacterized protein A4U43_C02F13560 [Asparagus officinalis]|uniref:Uncharacterized protein n=1 Tax=Asparagus officinalis TaxID=4686 RepID=A0A5P1FM48_ASPOF|nr:uncharacterized protein A4U43_C02F13560 [Asparagus officinalis]
MNAKAMSDNKKGNDKKGGEKSNGGKKDGKTVEKDNKGGSNNNGKNSKKGGEKNEVPAMNPKMMGHGPNIGNGPLGAIQGLSTRRQAIQGMPAQISTKEMPRPPTPSSSESAQNLVLSEEARRSSSSSAVEGLPFVHTPMLATSLL